MNDGALTPNQDAPANQFVVLDILRDLLAFAENPGGMGSYLTRQLREFFGARIVALVQYQDMPGFEPERIIAIHPDRFRHWERMGSLRELISAGRHLSTATLLQAEDPSMESARALQDLGVQTAIAVPLMLGNDAVGCLWAIDLLETIRSADTVQTLAMLSPVVALVLRNATFFESLESEIQVRTRDLTRSERQYRELTEAVPVGIFHLDAKGNHVYANEQWYGITGLHGFDGGAPRFEEFIHPEDRDEAQRVFGQILQTKDSAVTEFRLVRADGQNVWVQTRIVPELDDLGQVTGIIGTMVDTTEKVRLEQAHSFLAQGHWLSTGEDIFKSMARFLAGHLGMDYVCIDRLVGDALEAMTLAVWFDGQFEDNVRYTLKDTPCGAAVGKTVCCFPRGVRHQFPKDQVLQDMNAESYLATTLWGTNGQPIGLIALIGRNPVRDSHFAAATLNLISQCTAPDCLDQRLASRCLPGNPGLAGLVGCAPA